MGDLTLGLHDPGLALSNDFQVRGPVLVVTVDRLTPVTTRGGVVDGTGELDPKWAGHAGIVADPNYFSNYFAHVVDSAITLIASCARGYWASGLFDT